MSVNYDEFSDDELLRLLRGGDEDAFSLIYRRYLRLVVSEGLKKLGDEDYAADTAQDVFASLWAKRERLPVIRNLAGYLINCAKNAVFNFFEHREVEARYTSSLRDYVNSGKVAHTDYLVREKEWISYINDAVESLPEKMKEVYKLRVDSGLSHKEVARTLGLSERTVNAQMINAIKRLKSRLTMITLFF
ncbi:sigma-70 family RNA polymerase sigma factor [Pedobacter sp. GR22-6]|uniref:sigma-70 family RNA polymerase sigma factor n=1 Tax=Pedobacter sp. GR22-6 TaxID=3127957 RepID=UPI00307CD341